MKKPITILFLLAVGRDQVRKAYTLSDIQKALSHGKKEDSNLLVTLPEWENCTYIVSVSESQIRGKVSARISLNYESK
jgi:hypothetical protein